jgi:hypothetical protein
VPSLDDRSSAPPPEALREPHREACPHPKPKSDADVLGGRGGRRFPRWPRGRARGKALPIVHFAGKMLSRKDGRRGHHEKFNVGDRHARPLRLLLSVLQHVDVLGDAIGLHVVLVHVRPEGDHVDGVEASAVRSRNAMISRAVTFV